MIAPAITSPAGLKVACWNAAWNGPQTAKGTALLKELLGGGPDVICCPEAPHNLLTEGWYGAHSDADYGYPITPGRRKVTLWSQRPWRDVDTVGTSSLPSGRFVAATTSTSFGDIRFIGVCIPWRMAHVTTGLRNRTAWEDHRAYLAGLPDALAKQPPLPTIIIGDFNQRLPTAREPKDIADSLRTALSGFDVWTTGAVLGLAHQPVCHVGGSEHFSVRGARGLSRLIGGTAVSDHDGIVVEIEPAAAVKPS